jgi:hypothetical protein
MGLLAIALEISSVLAGDEWAGQRGKWAHRVSTVAMATSGIIVLGGLTYGLAMEGWRLAGVARSAAAELRP